MGSALFAYNEQIYSCDEADKKLSNEELTEAIESTAKSSYEDIEVHSNEKSSDYFKFLKYAIPAHYDGVFDKN